METLYSSHQMCVSESEATSILETTLHAFEVEAEIFGYSQVKDAKVRLDYIAKAKQLSYEYLDLVAKGQLSPLEAAEEVNKIRNEIMDLSRLKSSAIGKAKATQLKKTGLLLEDLLQKYARRLYNKDFTYLSKMQQNKAYLEVIKAAGRSRPSVNLIANKSAKLGKGLLVLSLGIAVYNVATADNKVRQAGKEGVIIGGGALGGMGGGAVAGLACGPGAPVCVTVGVFVGGLLGAFGTEIAFDRFF